MILDHFPCAKSHRLIFSLLSWHIYNLCKIAFDPETGTYGDHVDTLFNAVGMGKSLTWPRPSYDGRYLLFTSRRNDGLYSHLYFASVDKDGRFTKPFMLPQKNPKEYYWRSFYSFNTPDFTKSKVSFDTRKAVSEVMSDQRIETRVR